MTETYLDVSSCPTCAGEHAAPPPSDGLRIYFEETAVKNGSTRRCKHLHYRRSGPVAAQLSRTDPEPEKQETWLPEPTEEK